jgi:predicted dehydrogenase
MHKTSTTEIPVAVIGCGAISQFFYAPTLSALAGPERLRVATLVDPSSENVSRLGNEFPNAQRFNSIEEAGIGPDHLVIVASPPRFHAAHSIYAVEKGAAVLCEKPMAASLEDAEAMVAAARRGPGLLAIGLYRRFFAATESIRCLIKQQSLGRLKSFQFDEGGPFGWQAASESFFRRSVTPGGVLYDTGVHTLDLALWWMGDPTNLRYEDDAMGGQEANCRLRLSYENGCEGEVRLSRDWKTENRYTFYFERGYARWTVNDANHLEVWVDGMPAAMRGELIGVDVAGSRITERGPARTNAQSFIEQVRNLAAAKRGLETIRIPAEEGVRSLRLIERCYEQRQLLDFPWFSAAEKSEACRLSASHIPEPAIV